MSTDRPMTLVQARDVCLAVGGRPLFKDLSFDIGPGLTFVRGGEGRGKSTLLRLLAGRAVPETGTLHRSAGTCVHAGDAVDADDRTPASTWWQSLQTALPEWDEGAVAGLVEGFGLAEHVDKPMHMLSTGSRRKVGLVAAAAARAALTLLDTPFAALDTASCRFLNQLLARAADDDRRAWVLADYELPAALERVRLAGCIELGD